MKSTINNMLGGVVQRAPASPLHGESVVDRIFGRVRTVLGNERGELSVLLEKPLDDLKQSHRAAVQKGNEIVAKLEKDGTLSPEDRQALRSADTEATELEQAIAEKEGDESTLERFRQRGEQDEARRQAARQQRPALYGDKPVQPDDEGVLTPGEVFVRSEAYQAWKKKFPEGGPSKGSGNVESEAVPVAHMRAAMRMRTATERLTGRLTAEGFRQLVSTTGEGGAGSLVRPDYRGLLEPGLTRPTVMRQLVTVIPVTGDAIEYAREKSRTSNARITPEANVTNFEDGEGEVSGLKPEGGLEFEIVKDTVHTIAEWVAATKRIISDYPALRAYIDAYLTDDLAQELEDQMVAGDGTDDNFTGILNTDGVDGISTVGLTTPTAFDLLRRAKSEVITGARTRPTAIALHPADNEMLDLQKVNDESNHYAGPGPFSGDQPPIWGMTRVEVEALPEGTAIVGDFRRAVLFDRESTDISVGTANDDFLRNILRVLAEMRAGFGVIRPAAFKIVEF